MIPKECGEHTGLVTALAVAQQRVLTLERDLCESMELWRRIDSRLQKIEIRVAVIACVASGAGAALGGSSSQVLGSALTTLSHSGHCLVAALIGG